MGVLCIIHGDLDRLQFFWITSIGSKKVLKLIFRIKFLLGYKCINSLIGIVPEGSYYMKYNEIIPVLMSLNGCLITTNLLIPSGTINADRSYFLQQPCHNKTLINAKLRTSQGQHLAFISVSWLTVSGDFPGDFALQSSIWAVLHLTWSPLLERKAPLTVCLGVQR